MAKIIIHEADKRGHANHGWLDAWHSFSFASWYDPTKVNFGMLRVLNDDTVAGGTGFGKHPHDNMEIVTVVLEGALEHKDSMGNTESIHVDEVQAMSAGTGITHSEYNHNKDEKVRLFQIWIFPEKQNVKPQYNQAYFKKEDRINKLQTIASPITNTDAGLKINQQAWIYRTALEEGKTITVTPHNTNNGLYLLLVEGNVTIMDKELNRRDAIGVYDTDAVEIKATNNSEVLIIEVPMH